MKLVVQQQNRHASLLSKLDTPDEIVMPKQVLNMSNGKERGMFWKAIVVVVGVTFAVVVAVGAGLAVSSYISKIDTGMTIKDVTDFLDEG
jgi:hypothetical protein